jgi:ferredoxin
MAAGQCVLEASRVFAQDSHTGLVLILDAQPPAGVHEFVLGAARNCPSGAIIVVGENSTDSPNSSA